ncbi:hypothetical protein B0H14DRAFT_3537000 [Mycena olivaceomarginata]|nr:hypothetical protein B0H14DRAFT_3537000 [Mycena olivaceomarginata]
MAPPQWATPPQLEYLNQMLITYRESRSNGRSAARFWVTLFDSWFSCFPVKTQLGLVHGAGAEPFNEAELRMIGDATKKMQRRLRTWFIWRAKKRAVANNGHSNSQLFQILKRKKKTRPLRAVEVYQKIRRAKIRGEVMNWGYGLLNEEAEAARAKAAGGAEPEWTDMAGEGIEADEQKAEAEAVERARWNRAARYEHVAHHRPRMEEMNAEHALGLRDDVSGPRLPEEYQHAIDQLPEVVARFTGAVEEETGWMGVFMAGGPMPNRDGAISIKTFCFGATPNGADFAATHSNFGEVKGEFGKFLKRAFPHEVRDAWGISVPEPDANADAAVPGGLIPFDSNVGSDEADDAPALQIKPKRLRRKKPTAAVSTAVSPPSPPTAVTAAHTVPTLAPSALATDYSIPDGFDQALLDIVTDFGATAVEQPPWTSQPALGWDDIVPGEDRDAASPWNGLSLPSTQVEENTVLPLPVAGPLAGPINVGALFAVDREVGGSPGCALRGTQTSDPASAAPLANLGVTSARRASATITTPTLAGSPTSSEPIVTPATPANGPPRSAAALAVWNARRREDSRMADPLPASEAASPSLREDPPPPPSPEVPEFPESRPRANVPHGHPLAPTKKVAAKKAPSRRRRRRRRGGEEGEEEGGAKEVLVPPLPPLPQSSSQMPLAVASLTGATAAAETARIRAEEQRLRQDQTEQLRISKALEKKAAEAEAATARCRNPAGGAEVVVVTRPQRYRAPARNPDGSPIVARCPKSGGTREEAGWPFPSQTPTHATDAALLEDLKKGKRKAADAPAAPKRKKARR